MEEQKKCEEWCGAGNNHPRCRKIVKIIILILLICFAVKIFNSDGRSDKNANQNTIVVSGKGELTVKPDIATVSFSVMEENLDVSKSSDAVNTKIGTIVNTLKADGVAEADIKTTGYNINPRYDFISSAGSPFGGKQVLAGYDVTDSIEVKIRDLSKSGKIVSDLGSLGITDMSGLTFTEDKYDDLVKQARDKAIADARTQAEGLARSLGVHLDKIVGYSEGNPMPIYYAASAAPMMQGKTQAVLPTGVNTITSNVTITYEIR
ncbi:MAG: SIMPL domain-containing protein [Bacteroidia bacterium]